VVSVIAIALGGLLAYLLILAALGLCNWRWFAIAALQPTLASAAVLGVYLLAHDPPPRGELFAGIEVALWWLLQVSLLVACLLAALLAALSRGIRRLWRRRCRHLAPPQ